MSVLKLCNLRGFPCLEVVNVSTSGTTTTFNFNNHPQFRNNSFYGGFFVKFPLTATSSNVVQFNTIGVSGSSVPVYDPDGDALTVASISNTAPNVRMFFYDRDANRVQLML